MEQDTDYDATSTLIGLTDTDYGEAIANDVDEGIINYVVSEAERPEKETEIVPEGASVDHFKFGPPQRMKGEAFEDYKLRRKKQQLQLKILHRYGRRSWPASKGTLRKQPLQPQRRVDGSHTSATAP